MFGNKTINSLFVLLFAFCGTLFAKDVNVEPEKNAILEVWESYGVEQDFMKYAAKEFEKKYAKYNVKINYSETDGVKTVEKMSLAVQGNTGADVYMLPHDRLGQAINAGIIMPNLVSADIIKDNFMPAAVQAATGADGKIYGFPLSIETYGLFYNKKYFPTAPKTFKEIIKVGKQMTDRDKNQYGIFFDVCNFYFSYCFLAMDGGYVFGNNGYNINDIGLNNKGAIQGLQSMLTLKPISFKIPPGKNQADAPMTGLFGEGKMLLSKVKCNCLIKYNFYDE
jgi:arabinogalactan oligomer / maltooligosaccharide transport system substrate-binding protein